MTIELDLDKVRELAREVMAEKDSDYVFKLPSGSAGCVNLLLFDADGEYINDTCPPRERVARMEPGCLVGSMFLKAGLTPEQIFDAGVVGMSVYSLLALTDESGMPLFRASENAKDWMAKAQRSQDMGSSWRNAFAKADEYVKIMSV